MFTGGYEHTEEKERLMREAVALREPFWDAAKEAWRRERLFRYLHWRRHGEHAARNFIQSWEVEDLQAEIAMWRTYAARGLRDEDILEELTALLERHFEMTWADALGEGTSPLLAQVGMPVWHAPTSSLVPDTIGFMRIFGAVEHPEPGHGWSYQYGARETGECFSLHLYDLSQAGIADGVADARTASEFDDSYDDMKAFVECNGGTLLMDTMIAGIEQYSDYVGRTAVFLEVAVEYETAEHQRLVAALSLCGFRQHFLKLRYTVPADVWHSEAHDNINNAINAEMAEYVAHYR